MKANRQHSSSVRPRGRDRGARDSSGCAPSGQHEDAWARALDRPAVAAHVVASIAGGLDDRVVQAASWADDDLRVLERSAPVDVAEAIIRPLVDVAITRSATHATLAVRASCRAAPPKSPAFSRSSALFAFSATGRRITYSFGVRIARTWS